MEPKDDRLDYLDLQRLAFRDDGRISLVGRCPALRLVFGLALTYARIV